MLKGGDCIADGGELPGALCLDEDSKRAGHRKAKHPSDSAGFQIIEDHCGVPFIRGCLNHSTFAQINLRTKKRMHGDRRSA